jgi:uncharacterized membrane protein (DUF2068 family)
MSYRPGGVVAIAVFFIIFAVVGFAAVIFLEFVMVASMAQAASISTIGNLILGIYIGLPPSSAVLFALTQSAWSAPSYGLYHIAAAILIIGSVIYLLSAVGLLMMKKWGYYLALIIGIFTIIGGIIGLLAIIGIIPLIFGIIVVVYLAGDVKHEFE